MDPTPSKKAKKKKSKAKKAQAEDAPKEKKLVSPPREEEAPKDSGAPSEAPAAAAAAAAAAKPKPKKDKAKEEVEEVKEAKEAKDEAKEGKDEKKEAKDWTSKDYYFDSYSHFGIHEEMLKDEVRMDRYSRAILTSKHLFKGKVVLDVGCGTGVLSMFAAQAGASKVFGVEMAAIHHQAREIVKANGFADVVTIINGKIEEIDLPVDKVDIIISEWMGYFLLYESMLDTVLFARDKWLRPGGLLFPDKASLYLCAIEDAEYRRDKIDFWDNVCGFNMSAIKDLAIMEPLVDTCNPEQVISLPSKILDIDLYKVTKEELDFESKFELKILRRDFVHALVSYFTVEFSETHPTKISFSTAPKAKYTHWKQTVFYLEEPIVANKNEKIEGSIKVQRNKSNPRDLDIQLETSLEGQSAQHKASRLYRLR